jgi:hypothetical protein
MNRILEFSPSQEEAVVARILVLVHQAVDMYFPSAEQANRQFTKTVFSGEGERTAGVRAAPDDDTGKPAAFGNEERTSPDGRPAASEDSKPYIPPPPPGRPAGSFAREPLKPEPPSDGRQAFASNQSPLGIGKSDHQALSKASRLESTIEQMNTEVGLDWIMRLTIAALIAGLILLAYFIWKFISLG